MDQNSFLVDLSESERTAFGRQEFGSQTHPQRVFSSIWALESEVNNGGFSTYFVNATAAETAPFVVEALNAIGATQTADICRRAIETTFPEGIPSSPDEISARAADLSSATEDALEELDAEFMAYPCDLTSLLYAFVARHPDEFGAVPDKDS